MRTERAIDHSELAGACSCGSPRAITTPVASREIGLLASARSVGYPHSAGAELVRHNRMSKKMVRLRSTHFPGLGRRLLGRSKSNVHQPRTAVDWIQICLSQYSAPVAIIVGFQSNQKECHEQGGRSRFSTPWASRPLHRDAHLTRSCCARVRGGHRSVENQSTLQDPYALLTFRVGPERR
jgi:hypothetical protein